MSRSSRRRISASGRVALAMLLALAIAIGALTLLAYVGVLRSLSTGVDQALVREADAYAAAMRGAPDDAALVDATRIYLGARTEVGLGPSPILLVAFSRNRVISNSEIRLERATGNSEALEPTSAAASLRTVRYAGERYRLVSSPVMTSAGEQIALFQAALTTTEAERIAAQVAATLGVTGLVVLAFGAALSMWAARRSLAPLRAMALNAAAVTDASPGTRIEYDGPPDELGILADALNSMLERLETAISEQRRFVADASHELRTPVAIIRGNSELIRGGGMTPADTAEAVQIIDDETRRMGRLVDDLLSLARVQGERHRPFQPLSVSTLLLEAADRARNLGDREVAIDCSDDVWVSGDPDLLDQALLNITSNAYAHTSDGGSIRLGCSTVGGTVRITVTDDGEGIPAEDLERLFDRFYRGRGPRPVHSAGSGLGLAITRRLVEVHGGTVSASNAEPHGATFTIELPAIDKPS